MGGGRGRPGRRAAGLEVGVGATSAPRPTRPPVVLFCRPGRRACTGEQCGGDEEELPALDGSGKVHGDVPTPDKLRDFDSDELNDFLKDLERSVGERIDKNVEYGRDRPHGQRQGKEQDTIKSIEKILKDRGK